MTAGRERIIRVGPAVIRVILTGEVAEVIGSYPLAESAAVPDATLRADLSTDFQGGGPKTSNYPEFNSKLIDPHTLRVERSDAKGTISFADLAEVRGEFEGEASPSSLEAMIRVLASVVLPGKNTLILHSSSIQSHGEAHVFSGVSGAGKSTIADMLASRYAVEILSDELLLLSKRDGAWHLGVAPFSGKIDLPHGRSVPLASINLLEQAPVHERSQMSPAEAMAELPRHVIGYVKHPSTLSQVLSLAGDLAEEVPCYRLRFAKRPDVGDLLDLPLPANPPSA